MISKTGLALLIGIAAAMASPAFAQTANPSAATPHWTVRHGNSQQQFAGRPRALYNMAPPAQSYSNVPEYGSPAYDQRDDW